MHSGTGVGVGYNVQIAVDTKHKLIAEQQVHSQVSDLGLLAETGRAARTSLGGASGESEGSGCCGNEESGWSDPVRICTGAEG